MQVFSSRFCTSETKKRGGEQTEKRHQENLQKAREGLIQGTFTELEKVLEKDPDRTFENLSQKEREKFQPGKPRLYTEELPDGTLILRVLAGFKNYRTDRWEWDRIRILAMEVSPNGMVTLYTYPYWSTFGVVEHPEELIEKAVRHVQNYRFQF